MTFKQFYTKQKSGVRIVLALLGLMGAVLFLSLSQRAGSSNYDYFCTEEVSVEGIESFLNLRCGHADRVYFFSNAAYKGVGFPVCCKIWR